MPFVILATQTQMPIPLLMNISVRPCDWGKSVGHTKHKVCEKKKPQHHSVRLKLYIYKHFNFLYCQFDRHHYSISTMQIPGYPFH